MLNYTVFGLGGDGTTFPTSLSISGGGGGITFLNALRRFNNRVFKSGAGPGGDRRGGLGGGGMDGPLCCCCNPQP